MKRVRYYYPVIILIAACILTRLPQLLDPNLMLDGDECVVALMAKHAWMGKEFPVFFWGQTYGFALIEIIFIIPFYAVLGVTTVSVKLAMLSLWTIGIGFFYKAMVQLNHPNKTLALLLALVVIACPAWIIWSMKARGGYLTSFTLSTITLYLLFYSKPINAYFKYSLLGILLYLIYESQLFSLAGLLPFVVFLFIKDRNIKHILITIVPASLLYITLLKLKEASGGAYPVPFPIFTFDAFIQGLVRFPEYLHGSLQGNYFFAWFQSTNRHYTNFADIFVGIFFSTWVIGLLHLLFNRKGFGLFITATIFIPLTILYSLPAEHLEGRYLLPVTAFTLFAVYIYTNKLRVIAPIRIGVICLIIIGVTATQISPVRFANKSNKQDLLQSINYLKQHNIKYAYATNCMLAWDVMFYSNEDILCRMFYFPGRYPAYDTTVDRALYAGEQTAVIGYDKEYEQMDLNIDVETEYFISKNPSKSTLEKAFHFPLSN